MQNNYFWVKLRLLLLLLYIWLKSDLYSRRRSSGIVSSAFISSRINRTRPASSTLRSLSSLVFSFSFRSVSTSLRSLSSPRPFSYVCTSETNSRQPEAQRSFTYATQVRGRGARVSVYIAAEDCERAQTSVGDFSSGRRLRMNEVKCKSKWTSAMGGNFHRCATSK